MPRSVPGRLLRSFDPHRPAPLPLSLLHAGVAPISNRASSSPFLCLARSESKRGTAWCSAGRSSHDLWIPNPCFRPRVLPSPLQPHTTPQHHEGRRAPRPPAPGWCLRGPHDQGEQRSPSSPTLRGPRPPNPRRRTADLLRNGESG